MISRAPVTHAVVVITYRRPQHVDACLTAIKLLNRAPDRLVVVDQSPDELTKEVCGRHPGVIWVDNRANAGNMTSSRNVGLESIDTDIVSFLDDDSNPTSNWAREVIECFQRHPDAGAVGGRIENEGSVDQDHYGPVGQVGRWGKIVGNFESIQGGDIQVHHIVGANMSFRTKMLNDLGGFRADFPGTAMGEDTDVALRIKAQGASVIYTSRALVSHTSAPHIVGKRFDLRYSFYAASNYVLLMRRNFGFFSTQTLGQLARPLGHLRENRSYRGRMARVVVSTAGILYGVALTYRRDGLRRPPNVRHRRV